MSLIPPRNQGLILWDIDGTLITTTRNNSASPHRNATLLHGIKNSDQDPELTGATDYEVLEDLVRHYEGEDKALLLNESFRKLDQESRCLDKESTFDILPGIPQILQQLKALGWSNGILTGNTSDRMCAKLEKADIVNLFEFKFMFFCKFGESRQDITQRARTIVDSNGGLVAFIIGDTPRDIIAARVSNFPIISVATGKYSKKQLNEFKPNLILSNFIQDLENFLKFIALSNKF